MGERITERMRRNLAEDILSVVPPDGYAFTQAPSLDSAPLLHFRLGLPCRTGLGVTEILIVGDEQWPRIIVFGDRQPCRGGNGLVSNLGYGLGWFGRPQGCEYLCEKFLRKGYHPQIAREWLKGFIDDVAKGERGASTAGLEVARRVVGSDYEDDIFSAQAAFEAFLHNELGLGHDAIDHDEGHGYDPVEAGWLAATQERFAQLLPGLQAGTSEQRFMAVAYGHTVTTARGGDGPDPDTLAGILGRCSDVFVASLPATAPGVAAERVRRSTVPGAGKAVASAVQQP